MRVEDLRLEDFRNYSSVHIRPTPGLNLVVGRNAQGKTNLLEAIYCLSGLGSPRGPDGLLVRQGAEAAHVHATVIRRERPAEIDLELKPGRGGRALLNKKGLRSMKGLGETCVSVFFGPDELSLVKGSPEGRRRFLDDLLVKLRPARLALRKEWDRVLKQRNALLRDLPWGPGGRMPDPTLEVWDEAFARAGAALAAERLRALAALVPFARKRYEEVAGGGALDLRYTSTWVPEELSDAAVDQGVIEEEELYEALVAKLKVVRPRELERGLSLAGPGRDDVTVRLFAEDAAALLEARSYASQGDQRTSALALKLGEHDLIEDTLGETPILLLDDVFSELDPSRREWLRDAVRGTGQTIVSTTDIEHAGDLDTSTIFEVRAGEVASGTRP